VIDDADDDAGRILTFEEAKQQWRQRIAELRNGDRADRRLASFLAQCRKNRPCELLECPKCMRRNENENRRT